jgi:large subunit ribosomal protein L17
MALVTHERIRTTLAKAKELRPFAERLVTLGKKDSLHARRQALSIIPQKDAVAKLFNELSPRFAERPGGYTRILKLGPRVGDGAEMAFIEFVDYTFSSEKESKEVKTTKGKKKAKEAKKERKEKPKPEVSVAEEEGEPEGKTTPAKAKKAAKKATKKTTKKAAKKTASKKTAKKATKKTAKKAAKKSSTKKKRG